MYKAEVRTFNVPPSSLGKLHDFILDIAAIVAGCAAFGCICVAAVLASRPHSLSARSISQASVRSVTQQNDQNPVLARFEASAEPITPSTLARLWNTSTYGTSALPTVPIWSGAPHNFGEPIAADFRVFGTSDFDKDQRLQLSSSYAEVIEGAERTARNVMTLGRRDIRAPSKDSVPASTQVVPLPQVRPPLVKSAATKINAILAKEIPSDTRSSMRLLAIYDIEAHMIYLPNGKRLEAHSGIGSAMDNVLRVNEKNRGPTPPNIYKLSIRNGLFHGILAIRLIPLDEENMYGRNGILAHPYMLGSSGESNGCVSIKNYSEFVQAVLEEGVDHLLVVTRLRPENMPLAEQPRTRGGELALNTRLLVRASRDRNARFGLFSDID